VVELWRRGCSKAEGQNFARRLMEMPANKLTPFLFTQEVKAKFEGRPNVKVTVRYVNQGPWQVC